MKFAIVTATTDINRAERYIASWLKTAAYTTPMIHIVQNGGDLLYLGSVEAFRQGVDTVLGWDDPPDIIACFHDDLLIREPGWDARIHGLFHVHPTAGLCGFGGARGLGTEDLYRTPYDPMQLARVGFRSNLVDAETHGERSLLAERVACLDGFSQVGRREFWEGLPAPGACGSDWRDGDRVPAYSRPWSYLAELGLVHHFYDGALGCIARRMEWDTWYLPVYCEHHGGQTAVLDQGYHAWAAGQVEDGDQGFWRTSHRIGYDAFRDVLPLRLPH